MLRAGNGDPEADKTTDRSSSIFRLELTPDGLAVADFFTPDDYATLDETNGDLIRQGFRPLFPSIWVQERRRCDGRWPGRDPRRIAHPELGEQPDVKPCSTFLLAAVL